MGAPSCWNADYKPQYCCRSWNAWDSFLSLELVFSLCRDPSCLSSCTAEQIDYALDVHRKLISGDFRLEIVPERLRIINGVSTTCMTYQLATVLLDCSLSMKLPLTRCIAGLRRAPIFHLPLLRLLETGFATFFFASVVITAHQRALSDPAHRLIRMKQDPPDHWACNLKKAADLLEAACKRGAPAGKLVIQAQKHIISCGRPATNESWAYALQGDAAQQFWTRALQLSLCWSNVPPDMRIPHKKVVSCTRMHRCLFIALGAGKHAREIKQFLSSHPAASKFRLVAFEPMPEAQKALRKFFLDHGLSKQAKVVPFGAWVENTTLTQMSPKDSSLCRSGPNDIVCTGFDEVARPSETTRTMLLRQEVPVLHFAEYLLTECSQGAREIVLWMDIEGAEYKLLRSLIDRGILFKCVTELRIVWHDNVKEFWPEKKQLMEAELIHWYKDRYTGLEMRFTDALASLGTRLAKPVSRLTDLRDWSKKCSHNLL
eukprot:gnl/MRDRNA2_/MRDRNA2_159009_c0_seq1.p1 gnl/MRDRNA2_/MRDRNA2_159009_c0~~gnl/MRDRNA2_/MRDRNA2_159009_c0_seq1.p1  ORF type:complete len:497 (-),score=41.94 gnl/MRDRNA2_/MRDRNA2_159009_c0_seq1:269-1729(-)